MVTKSELFCEVHSKLKSILFLSIIIIAMWPTLTCDVLTTKLIYYFTVAKRQNIVNILNFLNRLFAS